MGIELELSILLALIVVGNSVFAVFEIETPAWRLILKWLIITALTVGVYFFAGHWAILVPVVAALAGVVFHFIWCRKWNIHPFRATPRRKYYELRGWLWHD
ncbi:MAG: hypothetical protein IIB00_02120 [candidate division Zixibacteria bacterium]|nr:hypothetical protein [candidate division Zixibacteria bacterium]